MTNTGTPAKRYLVQPMTGMFHTDPTCSQGTARYGLVESSIPNAESDELIRAGRVKSCKRCGPAVVAATR